jgi:hypothetical protein
MRAREQTRTDVVIRLKFVWSVYAGAKRDASSAAMVSERFRHCSIAPDG